MMELAAVPVDCVHVEGVVFDSHKGGAQADVNLADLIGNCGVYHPEVEVPKWRGTVAQC